MEIGQTGYLVHVVRVVVVELRKDSGLAQIQNQSMVVEIVQDQQWTVKNATPTHVQVC